MSTQFACPSPRGTNHAGLYLTKGGTLVDRHGNDWGASSIRRMANDAALGAPPGTGTGERKWGPSDWAANKARHALGDALEEACTAHGLTDDQHQELRDLVAQHLHGTAHSGGAAATDKVLARSTMMPSRNACAKFWRARVSTMMSSRRRSSGFGPIVRRREIPDRRMQFTTVLVAGFPMRRISSGNFLTARTRRAMHMAPRPAKISTRTLADRATTRRCTVLDFAPPRS
jgi:hypothetical protein